MAKFRIRLKVQALELEIDGEREDIPALGAAVRQQFAGLIKPAELTLDAKQLSNGDQAGSDDADDNGAKGKGKSRRRASGSRGGEGAATAIDFRHDAAKYGNPFKGGALLRRPFGFSLSLKESPKPKR